MRLMQADTSFRISGSSQGRGAVKALRFEPFKARQSHCRGRSVCAKGLTTEEETSLLDDARTVVEVDLLHTEERKPAMAKSTPSAAELSKQRRAAKARHQLTYKVAAISASLGVTAMAVTAVHYRFAWHRSDGSVPWQEAAMTILLVFGGVIGMEMWARWAHKALWHDLAAGWALHESHHRQRVGPFEANDVFAVVNAVPAIALCAYGFFTPTMLGGIAFGSGLGITLFGMMYMFVHDGLVHRRFPVGPLADVPYLKKVAAAHTLHHAEKFNGVPWGLFLGPQELEAVGGQEELNLVLQRMDKVNKNRT